MYHVVDKHQILIYNDREAYERHSKELICDDNGWHGQREIGGNITHILHGGFMDTK